MPLPLLEDDAGMVKVAGGVTGVAPAGARRSGRAPLPASRRRSTASCAASRSRPSTGTCSTSPRATCGARAARAACCSTARGAGGGHYRLVPERRLRLTGFELADAAWEELRIPVDMAFFFHSSAAERVVAFYPGPMGATESLLELSAWEAIEGANPVLAGMEPDVEALLVNRARGARDYWLVPIDDCYGLVGLIRTRWRGLTGRQGGMGGDRALLRARSTGAHGNRGQRGDDDHVSTSYPYLKVGKPDVAAGRAVAHARHQAGQLEGQLREADRATCRTAA